MAGTLSGTVKDAAGNFVARTVRAYSRATGALAGSTVSDATTGAWSISTPDTATHYAVALGADASENGLIFDSLSPISSGSSGGTTVLLLHGDNAVNNAEEIIDSSPSARTPSELVSTSTQTSVKQFGPSSIKANAFDARLNYAASVDFALSGSWCLEFWVRMFANPLDQYFMASNASRYCTIDTAGNFGPVNYGVSASFPLTIGAWTHVAIACDGATTRLFKDGNLIGTGTTPLSETSAQPFGVVSIPGRTDLTSATYCHFDEVRLMKGDPVYTAPFTPPTAAFT